MPASPALSLDDFDYVLPPGQIAQHPAARRDGAQLLDLRAASPVSSRITALPRLLQKGDLLIINDSKVIPARLHGHKPTGGKVEIFAERFLPDNGVLAQIRSSKPLSPGDTLNAGGEWIVHSRNSEGFYLLYARDKQGNHCAARPRFLRRGVTPLPPYIRRPPKPQDESRYQTIFARRAGAVAAPTAGLHFTPQLFQSLTSRGVSVARITLHVGAGTFLPLRRGLATRTLHAEQYRISAAAAARINAVKKRGGRIVAAGTTVLRALESASDKSGVLSGDNETTLFIKPGFIFRTVDCLLTNFHLPRSSLLVLVCAFGGRQRVLRAYEWAVKNQLRFYSYGDAMLVARHHPENANEV